MPRQVPQKKQIIPLKSWSLLCVKDLMFGDREIHHDTLLFYHAWLSLAREAIVEKLCRVSGFQLNKLQVSNPPLDWLVPLEAPFFVNCELLFLVWRLLLTRSITSCKLREEIDPGSEKFWHVVDEHDVPIEWQEEKQIYSLSVEFHLGGFPWARMKLERIIIFQWWHFVSQF